MLVLTLFEVTIRCGVGFAASTTQLFDDDVPLDGLGIVDGVDDSDELVAKLNGCEWLLLPLLKIRFVSSSSRA